MIKIPKDKVAIIPIYDSKETRGGIIKAESFVYMRDKAIWEIFDNNGRLYDETDDQEQVAKLIAKYNRQGIRCRARKKKARLQDQMLDSGERCDQGVVKYIGYNIHDVKIGDYVFFSGYTGTLMSIEGEGKLIIMPGKFIECVLELDEFITIPGLYFKDRNGNYFEANYEQAMNLCAEAFTLKNKTIEVSEFKPKLEDYNVNR